MAEMDFNQVLEWLKEEMEKLNEHKTEKKQLKDSANEVINAKDIIIRRLNKENVELRNKIDDLIEDNLKMDAEDILVEIKKLIRN